MMLQTLTGTAATDNQPMMDDNTSIKESVVKGDCTPDVTDGTAFSRAARRRLPTINKQWDANKTYHQMVILFSFKDVDFQSDDPKAAYDSILNVNGYNKRDGKGCMAEYFRDQSYGRLNLQFDIYGPVKIDTLAQPYPSPNENTRNYGRAQFAEATKKVLSQYPDVDYTQYDWNGDGSIEQVIYIYAGYSGNQSERSYGYIWPNTSSITAVTTPDKMRISNYTCSGEMWVNNTSCGFGTICHEYTHSLGLPDIYPTTANAGFSVVDEWDLMDGGNFTNLGWCPPNFTPIEKYLLGWLDFVDLEEPTTITDMKPSAEGGPVYRIKHSANEWLLLENRQQRGWDFGAPGKGLVIYHVCYDKSVWSGNSVNNNVNKRRFELVHADNMDYDEWEQLSFSRNIRWANKGRLNNVILSTSPYPWTTDSTDFVNDRLTETSVPAPKMNYTNDDGNLKLEKSITNIRMNDEGLISFDFMKDDGSDVSSLFIESSDAKAGDTRQRIFGLTGQRLVAPRKGVNIVGGKKVVVR